MSDHTAVMRQALEALEYHTEQTRPIFRTEHAITALRDALAAPAEPAVYPVSDFQLELLFDSVHEYGGFGRAFRENARRILNQTTAPPAEPVAVPADIDSAANALGMELARKHAVYLTSATARGLVRLVLAASPAAPAVSQEPAACISRTQGRPYAQLLPAGQALPLGTNLYASPAAPAAQEETVPPVLVRDAAAVLGVGVPDVCNALRKLGRPERSTNMAISGEELVAVAERVAAPAAQALTDEQMRRGWSAISLHPYVDPLFIDGVRFAERAHGISQGGGNV